MTGLIGWWPLHENTGNTARDLSRNGNHGTLNGGVTQGVAGKGGLIAFDFDGSSSYVELPDLNPDLDSGPPVTFTAFVRHRGSTDEPQTVIGNIVDSSTRNGTMVISQESSNNVLGYYDTTATTYSSLSVPKNEWAFIAVVDTGEDLIYYVNENSEIISGASDGWDGGGDWEIGRRAAGPGWYFSGIIQDVRAYNRTLSSNELQELYKWGDGDYANPPSMQDGGITYLDFNSEGALDQWNQNDGTVEGATYLGNGGPRGDGAYSFDGQDDYISMPSTPFETGSSFTFSVWWNTTDIGDKQPLLQLVGGDNFFFNINDSSSGYTTNTIDCGTENDRLTLNDERADDGNWHHAVVVYDDIENTLSLFVNGSKEDQISANGSMSSFDEHYFGRLSTSVSYPKWFGGKIDDARYYNRALEPHEIFQLYQWGTKGRDMRKFTLNARGGS